MQPATITAHIPAHSGAACGADAQRSLTRTDLLLCVVPIAVFLSIVSFV
jgi:hypothetical protein